MKRRNSFVFLLVMLLSFCVTAHAQEHLPDFYCCSMAEDLQGNTEVLQEVETEINAQMSALMEMGNMQLADVSRSFTTADAVKVATIESANAREVLAQLESAKDLVMQRDEKNTKDLLTNLFLSYSWQVPVVETANQYGYATVKINAADDVVIFSTISPKKELSNAAYIFDREIIAEILNGSTLDVDTRAVLPVSLSVISTDILLFSADGQSYAIPFSARPDLLEVENGKIYPYDKLTAKVKSLLTELTADSAVSAAPVGGGVGQTDAAAEADNTSYPPLLLPIILATLVVGIGGYCLRRKKHAD